MKYICEFCKKEYEQEPNKWAWFIKCECGGRAFEEGFDPKSTRSHSSCRGL